MNLEAPRHFLSTWTEMAASSSSRCGGRAHLFGVLCVEECVAGLQVDRTDHETSRSLAPAASGQAHAVAQDLLAVFHTWNTTTTPTGSRLPPAEGP